MCVQFPLHGVNLSDHLPISFVLAVNISFSAPSVAYNCSPLSSLTCNWSKAEKYHIDDYQNLILTSLPCLPPDMEQCCVPDCSNHIDTLESYSIVFCSGICQQWIHRYCGSISTQCYQAIREKNKLFRCFGCCTIQDGAEVEMLKNTIAEMKLEIAALHESLRSTRTESTSQVNASANLDASGRLHQTHAVGESSSETNPTGILHTPLTVDAGKKQRYHPDKKFNIVVYGIDECSKGTPRHNRLINDVHKVVSVLSSVDITIQSQSIKDCLRLGKFNPNQQHPRPLLVRFVRITDASNILSKRKDFYSPISIKPDMSPAERLRDSILLKERWKLIQSGVARSDIKINEARMFVKRKLYGQVLNSTFQKQSQAPIVVDQLDMSSNRGDKSSTIVQSNSTLLSDSSHISSSVTRSSSSTTINQTVNCTQSSVTSDTSSIVQPNSSDAMECSATDNPHPTISKKHRALPIMHSNDTLPSPLPSTTATNSQSD